MMISPEAYYEMYLKGKSQTAVSEQIELFQNEIRRLKQLLEHDPKNQKALILPSPLTKIRYYREYFAMAKRALEEAGGHYEPTEEEGQDQSFHRALADMHRFTLEIGGFFRGYTKYQYTLHGEMVLFDAEHSFYLKTTNLPVYEPFTREEFLQGLAEIHIGEWKPQYVNHKVLDGKDWRICIEYREEDGQGDGQRGTQEPVYIYGCNAYPYNFQELLEFLGIDEAEGDEVGEEDR